MLTPTYNLGFAAGSNLGLNAATADAVLFCNNDIELAHAGWLDAIRDQLEPGVLVGELRDHPLTEVDGVRYPYLDGWALAGMRADLLELGGFDETLEEPSYFSDNDLCFRARAAGMTLRDVRIGLRHKENTTAGPAWTESVQAATTTNRAIYQARVRELMVVNSLTGKE